MSGTASMTHNELRAELHAAYRAIVALGASINTLTAERDAARAESSRGAAQAAEEHGALIAALLDVTPLTEAELTDVLEHMEGGLRLGVPELRPLYRIAKAHTLAATRQPRAEGN